jgi:hypothetical protein
MFIVRGEDGGRIDASELETYPPGHLYCVQPKAWMDRVRWDEYLVEMLEYLRSIFGHHDDIP